MTRSEALRFTIRIMEQEQRKVSEGWRRLTPMEGKEEKFHELEDAIHELKEIGQALQADGVRKSLAEWQERVMENGPEALPLDGDYYGEKALRMSDG